MKYCIQAALYVRKMQRIRATGAREIVTLTVTQAIVKKKVLNFTIRAKILQFIILPNIEFVKDKNIYLSDEFNQISRSFCSLANTYGVYDQLAIAKLACISDDSCIGIYDQSGDATGKMRLCQKGFIISDEYFSTIYQKKEYSGKNYRYSCNCL